MISNHGLAAFLLVMETRIPHKAKEKEDNMVHLLDAAIAKHLQTDLHELEDSWKAHLFDRHKEDLMQVTTPLTVCPLVWRRFFLALEAFRHYLGFRVLGVRVLGIRVLGFRV